MMVAMTPVWWPMPKNTTTGIRYAKCGRVWATLSIGSIARSTHLFR